MIGRLAAWAAVVVCGVALGAGSAYVAVERFSNAGQVTVGAWRTNLNTGARSADPYVRTAIAAVGLLALTRAETIYFFRTTDEDGARLDPACTYRLTGKDQPARWWSITLYDEAFYLARNADEAASVDATRAQREADGGYTVAIGPAKGVATNWLSTNGAKAVHLNIRLYNPDPSVQNDPSRLVLPSIVKVSCPTGGAA